MIEDDDIDLLAPVDADAGPVETQSLADQVAYWRGRAEQAEALVDDPDVKALLQGQPMDPSAFIRPVGVTLLGTVWGIEPRRLHKKLKNCPIVGRGTVGRGKGQPLYDFKTACEYICDPKIDLETWFSSLSTTTMPPIIMEAFWKAVRMKNKVMEEMGSYWHSEDVLALFGEVNMLIKNTTLLWIEELPGKANLSTQDYHALHAQVKGLLNAISRMLVEAPTRSRTESVVKTLEQDIAEGKLGRVSSSE